MPGNVPAQSLVDQLNAQQSNVAVIGGDVHGNVIFGGDLRSAAEHVLDFSTLVQSVTRGFVGRREVFAALEDFCAANTCGYFEIVADAGLGKTALAAEIAGRYDALMFFASASRGLTRPEQLLTHLSGALITRFALPYDRLPSRVGDDSTFLSRVLGEAAAKAACPVWIVVDALDEAEPPPPRANPLLLPTHVPPGVYFVVTHRPTRSLFVQPDTPRAPCELRADAPQQEADIEEYLRQRVTADGPVKSALARTRPPIAPATFIDRLRVASGGNFMYVSYVLGDIAAHDVDKTPLDLDHLPHGLQGYYEQFWSDMEQAKAEGWTDWRALYRPTIERLAVAAESVSAEWIGAQIGRDFDEVRERVLLRWTRLLSAEGTEGRESWRVIHRSFADFLKTKVDLAAAHRAVAEHYAGERWNRWDAFDDYGLRHTPMHLAAAAMPENDVEKRHELAAKLVSLVLAPGYQHQYLTRLLDPSAFERALDLALKTISLDAWASPRDVAEVALRLVAYRKEQRLAKPIFDLARSGQVEAAERRLDLFALDVDRAWYEALLLTVAWLGASQSPEKARALRDRVHKRITNAPGNGALDLLLARVDVKLHDAALPALSLRPQPTREEAQLIVLRLGASAVDRSLMGADVELMNRLEPIAGTMGYLAEVDGPNLVAMAVFDPAFGEPLLQQYVALHAAYGYREYRQGSLWALLEAVLQHPSQEWVQAWVSALGAAVLAPNRGEFRESLVLATLGLQVTAGEPGAAEVLERRRIDAVRASETPSSMPSRGLVVDPVSDRRGDTWGTNRRRLAALAEALSRVPGQQPAVRDVVERALSLRWGFAGFNAPACLTLAEAIEVASPEIASITQALTIARTSAHNIQDGTFCVRTTARVTAMMDRWWGAPPMGAFDAAAAAGRLADDPRGPEFAAIHHVGDKYEDRDPVTTIPMPDLVLAMNTLKQLALAFQRPLDDFQRLNGELLWVEDVLSPGTRVNVPDPGLPPLLAARFTSRALADPALSSLEQQTVIRKLVPAAAADATALDSVLARLVLASRSQDRTMLSGLIELAMRSEAEAPPDAALAVQLTSFVP